MADLAAAAGLLRSLIIYYGLPLRHRRLVQLYREFVAPGDLVIDAGAHVGNHTRAFLALGARVVAVEPQPLFAGWLRWLTRRQEEVALVEAALSAVEGEAELLVSARNPTVSTLSADWAAQAVQTPSFAPVRWDRRVRVQVCTLDGLIEQHGLPAFIKLDVEGFEAQALAGLTQAVAALCFEVLPANPQPALACLDRLDGLGRYAYNWTIAETACLQPDWVDREAAVRFLSSLPPGGREINLFARRHA